jgi:hypothetical protein
VAKQFAAMQAEIEELKAELKNRVPAAITPAVAPTPAAPASVAESRAVELASVSASTDTAQSRTGLPENPSLQILSPLQTGLG